MVSRSVRQAFCSILVATQLTCGVSTKPKGREELFCHIDNFCQKFEAQWHQTRFKYGGIKRFRAKSMCLSEIMTILTVLVDGDIDWKGWLTQFAEALGQTQKAEMLLREYKQRIENLRTKIDENFFRLITAHD